MSNSSMIRVNTKALKKASRMLEEFPKSNSRKVMNRVLKRMVSAVKTETAQQMSTVFAISPAQVRSALNASGKYKRLFTSTSKDGKVSIAVLGRPLTATRFIHSPESIPKQKSGRKPKLYRATLTVYRNKGSRMLPSSVFVAPIKYKEKGAKKYLLYQRTGERNEKGKEKLRVIRSVSIPQAILNKEIAVPLSKRIGETALKRLEHEVQFEIDAMWQKVMK